ncbi:hypothetical protein KR044_002576, partial [Drosophila immigrans]
LSTTSDRLHPSWWSGGMAGSVAYLCVTPFDVLESHMMILKKDRTTLQTARRAIRRYGKPSYSFITINNLSLEKYSSLCAGFIALYDGLTAQLFRQFSYGLLRFHLYDVGKQYVDENNFLHKIFVATISGIIAGSVGIPSEMINTRMQVDRVLAPSMRRNYRHVFDGFSKVYRNEGFAALYTGGTYAITRAALVTIGQNAMYDQCKMLYLRYLNLEENSKGLHLLSSLSAGIVCAPLVQPVEVLKTLKMVAGKNHWKTRGEMTDYMLRFGLRGLFRGFTATLYRMVGSTIITMLVYEELRFRFGYYKKTF